MGLDPRSSFLLKELMRAHVREGGSVFFSTHVMEVAERLCDRLGIINKGKLIAVGTTDEIRNLFAQEGDKTLEEIFLKITEAKLPEDQLASLASRQLMEGKATTRTAVSRWAGRSEVPLRILV